MSAIVAVAMVGDVAQLGEHLLCKQGVVGSNPIVSTSMCRDRCVLVWLGLCITEKCCGFGSVVAPPLRGEWIRKRGRGAYGQAVRCDLCQGKSGSGTSLGVPGCDV